MYMKAIVISEGKVLLSEEPCGLPEASVLDTLKPSGERFHFPCNGMECHAVAVEAGTEAPQGHRWHEVRASVTLIGEEKWMAVAKAVELLGWASVNRYCSRCGQPMRRQSEISLICTGCGTELWPQLSPCVMVLVRKGDEALLVHAANFRRPFFGLVAGFVETGETLEECVRREVAEETGLQIENIRYAASQSWPFPAQLMIGFTADYAGGEVRFADGELTAGGFFSRDKLPMIPPPPSLARKLIDSWLTEK